MTDLILGSALRLSVAAGAIGAMLWLVRLREPAARHSVWTMFLVAMPLMPALVFWMPRIEVDSPPVAAIPLWRDDAPRPAPAMTGALPQSTPASAPPGKEIPPPAPAPPDYLQLAWLGGVAIQSMRLFAGYLTLAALSRRARVLHRVGRAMVCESAAVAAPVTFGPFRPRVLLPPGFTSRRAAVAHELAHVRRRDSLVSLFSAINLCVYWFHPLAWWLDRKLTALAEQSCDDRALRRFADPRTYVEGLLESARRVARRGGRLLPHSLSFRGSGDLHARVRRILEFGARPSPTPVRLACACLAAAMAIAGAACSVERRQTASQAEWPKPRMDPRYLERSAAYEAAVKMTPEQVEQLEISLRKSPGDLDARRKLLMHYWRSTPDFYRSYQRPADEAKIVTQRRRHILWVIENQPESELARDWVTRIFPTAVDPLHDPAGYRLAKAAWLRHARNSDASANVLRGAFEFLATADKATAEEMLLRAIEKDRSHAGTLGRFYYQVLVGSNGSMNHGVIRTVSMAEAHGPHAMAVRKKIEASRDVELLCQLGQQLHMRGVELHRSGHLDFDPRPLARGFVERAARLAPNDPLPARTIGYFDIFEARERLNSEMAAFAKAEHAEAREQMLSRQSPENRLTLLPQLIHGAYFRDRLQEARNYCEMTLRLASELPNHPESPRMLYEANMVLGKIALRNKDKKEAGRYLLLAAEKAGWNSLIYQRTYELHRHLVDWGEREVVAKALEVTAQRADRDKEKLLEWAAAIRRGEKPAMPSMNRL